MMKRLAAFIFALFLMIPFVTGALAYPDPMTELTSLTYSESNLTISGSSANFDRVGSLRNIAPSVKTASFSLDDEIGAWHLYNDDTTNTAYTTGTKGTNSAGSVGSWVSSSLGMTFDLYARFDDLPVLRRNADLTDSGATKGNSNSLYFSGLVFNLCSSERYAGDTSRANTELQAVFSLYRNVTLGTDAALILPYGNRNGFSTASAVVFFFEMPSDYARFTLKFDAQNQTTQFFIDGVAQTYNATNETVFPFLALCYRTSAVSNFLNINLNNAQSACALNGGYADFYLDQLDIYPEALTPCADGTLTKFEEDRLLDRREVSVLTEGNGTVTGTIDDVEIADLSSFDTYPGQSVCLEAQGEDFYYWLSPSGSILSTDPSLTIPGGKALSLRAVFRSEEQAETINVYFRNLKTSRVVAVRTVNAGEALYDLPQTSLKGYTFTGWSIPEGTVINETTEAYALFEKDASSEVRIDIRQGGITTSVTRTFGAIAGVTCLAPNFSYWTLDGKIVSLKPAFRFCTPSHDCTLEAVCGADTAPEAVAASVDFSKDGRTLYYLMSRSVPSGATLEETGVLLTRKAAAADLTIDTELTTVTRGVSKAPATSDVVGFYKDISGKAGTWLARGYVIYRLGGNTHVIYTDVSTVEAEQWSSSKFSTYTEGLAEPEFAEEFEISMSTLQFSGNASAADLAAYKQALIDDGFSVTESGENSWTLQKGTRVVRYTGTAGDKAQFAVGFNTIAVEQERLLAAKGTGVAESRWFQYLNPTGTELREIREFQSQDDTSDYSEYRDSADNGRTWTEWMVKAAITKEKVGSDEIDENLGYPNAQHVWNPVAQHYVSLECQFLYEGGYTATEARYWAGETRSMHNFLVVETLDGTTYPRQMVKYEEGADYNRSNYHQTDYLTTNIARGSDLIVLRNGDILFNMCIPVNTACEIAGVDRYDVFPSVPGNGHAWALMVARGTWNESTHLYEISYSEPIILPDTLSTRGISEPMFAELASGRIICEFRISTDQRAGWNCRLDPNAPDCKYYTYSDDGGVTFSDPEPWLFDDGGIVTSPATFSLLVRSEVNGKLYWFGNHTDPAVTSGSYPRFPLQVCEVDEETGCLIRETLTVIDTRRSGENSKVQLSNFKILQNRETGQMELYLIKLDQFSGRGKFDCETWKYTIILPMSD